MKYEYQGLDLGSKVQYVLNGIRCDKLSTAVATVMAHPDKFQKYFDAVVAFFTPKLSVKAASVTQTRPAKQQKSKGSCCIFTGKIKLKKYSQDEYNSMLMAQHHQWYELMKKARIIKGKNIPNSSRAFLVYT